jgi:hypothetical protein
MKKYHLFVFFDAEPNVRDAAHKKAKAWLAWRMR